MSHMQVDLLTSLQKRGLVRGLREFEAGCRSIITLEEARLLDINFWEICFYQTSGNSHIFANFVAIYPYHRF